MKSVLQEPTLDVSSTQKLRVTVEFDPADLNSEVRLRIAREIWKFVTGDEKSFDQVLDTWVKAAR